MIVYYLIFNKKNMSLMFSYICILQHYSLSNCYKWFIVLVLLFWNPDTIPVRSKAVVMRDRQNSNDTKKIYGSKSWGAASFKACIHICWRVSVMAPDLRLQREKLQIYLCWCSLHSRQISCNQKGIHFYLFNQDDQGPKRTSQKPVKRC